ncbi:hypothetical protein LOTGIDRAFT_237178, partial [Lottia gigantea]
MYIQVYFDKIVILLVVNLYVVSGFEPKFTDMNIKDSVGNTIQIHNKLTCYAERYTDVRCTDSGYYVAPLIYHYGIKPMVFQEQHNCTKDDLSVLPIECCVPDSNDCTFEDTNHIIQIWKICGYSSHCKSLIGGRTDISEMRDHNCGKKFIKESDITTSQYSYLRYACLPEKMEVNFDGGNGKGKALLLKTKETTYNTGIKLQCHITTDNNNGLLVQFVDVRLCRGDTRVCDQALTIFRNGKEAGKEISGSKFGLETWFGSPGQPNVIITFERQSPTTKYNILLYITTIYGFSDIEIKCDQPLPITTTTTIITTTVPSTTSTTRAEPLTTATTTTDVEIVGAGVAGILLASFICLCTFRYTRNKPSTAKITFDQSKREIRILEKVSRKSTLKFHPNFPEENRLFCGLGKKSETKSAVTGRVFTSKREIRILEKVSRKSTLKFHPNFPEENRLFCGLGKKSETKSAVTGRVFTSKREIRILEKVSRKSTLKFHPNFPEENRLFCGLGKKSETKSAVTGRVFTSKREIRILEKVSRKSTLKFHPNFPEENRLFCGLGKKSETKSAVTGRVFT